MTLNAKPNLYLYLKHVFLVIVFGINNPWFEFGLLWIASSCGTIVFVLVRVYFVSIQIRKQKQHILSDSMCARETASTMRTKTKTKHSFQKKTTNNSRVSLNSIGVFRWRYVKKGDKIPVSKMINESNADFDRNKWIENVTIITTASHRIVFDKSIQPG